MKVTIDYDTITKELVVKKDGMVVDNVSALDFYRSYDYDDSENYVRTNKFRMNLAQDTADNVNKTSERIMTCARVFGYKDEN